MSQALYRRKAILVRVHQALDAFYLLQNIDWEYDVRATIDKILGLAMQEIEFDGGKVIERALIILQPPDGSDLEVKAGWRADEPDLAFSRTVVHETIRKRQAILCADAKGDPRFMEAESIKTLNTLSLISVPIEFAGRTIGAFYVESKSPGNVFDATDLEFLAEFTTAITPYLKTAITHQDHVREIRELRGRVAAGHGPGAIIGRSEAVRSVDELVRIAAQTDRTVLVTGESGTGKELVAQAIHQGSHRRDGKFVIVDCSSLAEHLLESELFGHSKGAFTGASHDKIGAFEEASGGTIFLDEISDASKPLQQKLRRVLQEGEIRRVGENGVRAIDVRVICATNGDLALLVASAQFIRDLYYRINKFPIYIPPLRERREDIPLLVQHFLAQLAATGDRRQPAITPDAVEALVSRDWAENNIRELRNTVELAADFAAEGTIDSLVLARVFRVQRGGGAEHRAAAAPNGQPEGEASGSDVGVAGGRTVVEIHRDRLKLLVTEMAREPLRGRGAGARESARDDRPFYRLQLEFSGQAIVEGLRMSDWKLRPAAKTLGISPMKLRGELKEFLQLALEREGGDLSRVAGMLDMPVDILRRKFLDLALVTTDKKRARDDVPRE